MPVPRKTFWIAIGGAAVFLMGCIVGTPLGYLAGRYSVGAASTAADGPNAAASPDVEAVKKAVKAKAFDPSSVRFASVEEATYRQILMLRARGSWKLESGRTVDFDFLCITQGKPGDPPIVAENPRGDNWRNPDAK